MLHSIFFSSTGQITRDLDLIQIQTALQDQEGLVWVNLDDPFHADTLTLLKDILAVHPLTIEDIQNGGYQPPKVDDFGSYLFIIVHALQVQANADELQTRELDLFLGANYLVTSHSGDAMPPVEKTFQRITRDERVHQNGSDFLCHALLDALVDDYMPLLDQLDDEIDWLEDSVLQKPEPETLERILTLKHSIMALRRIVGPEREIINRLSRDDFPLIDRQSRIYFRDIYDHLVRIQDLSESLRDIVSGALDIYLSSTSLRMNEVMKALTVVSTIFLPLTFLTGVYGMNFKIFPEVNWQYGYPMAWGIFLLTIVIQVIYFKRKGWF